MLREWRQPAEFLGPFSGAPRDADLELGSELAEASAAPDFAAEAQDVEAVPDELAPWLDQEAGLWSDAPSLSDLEPEPVEEPASTFLAFVPEVEESPFDEGATWVEFPMDVPEPEVQTAATEAAEPLIGEELLGPAGTLEAAPEFPPAELATAATALAAADARVPSAGNAMGQPVLEDVATRLERIAHALRVGTPADLLGDASDPLQILIAGYALGLAHAARTVGEAPRKPSG